MGGGAIEPVKNKEKPEPETVSLINTAQDAALKYLADSPFNTEKIRSIHPNVFFTPIMNLLAAQDSEVQAFYDGMNFMGKPLTPTKSRLYYFMHPIHADREVKSSESPDMWRRYIFGRLYGVYSVLIRPARALKHKLAALKSLYVYHSRAKSISKAYNLGAAYPVISFDVFDTLVFRKCTSSEVFDAAEKKYNALRADKDKAESFRDHRIKAQALAGKTTVNQEITLDEIYDELADEYGGDFAESMKSAEINAELDAVYPNAEMQSFYNAMKAAGKRIIIASDMYLPGKVIAAILEKCGYDGYTSLYVSSECRVRKSSGALFRRVVRDEGVSPSEILHIGDNMYSDCIMAEHEGLRGFLYKK